MIKIADVNPMKPVIRKSKKLKIQGLIAVYAGDVKLLIIIALNFTFLFKIAAK